MTVVTIMAIIGEGTVARETGSWSVADARARFSEVIDRALSNGPQTISRKGRRADARKPAP